MSPAGIHARDLKKVLKGSLRAHEALVEACITLLALYGVPAVPIHTGPRVTPRAGGGFDLRTNPRQRGFGDLVGPLPPQGRMLFVECKTGNARRSPAQVRMKERLELAGALCLTVRSATDLEQYLDPRRSRIQGGTR